MAVYAFAYVLGDIAACSAFIRINWFGVEAVFLGTWFVAIFLKGIVFKYFCCFKKRL